MRGLGTLLNMLTVAVGATLGVIVGDRLPERMRQTIMHGLGLVTLAVGVVGMKPLFHEDLGLRRFLILIASMILGAIVGEGLRLEDRLERAGDSLRRRFGVADGAGDEMHPSESGRFVEGFVLASTVFCVGPLTVLGAIEDGLGISIRLLAIKSALDGFAAVGFAAVYGWGVMASLVTLAVYQGALTLLGLLIEPVVTNEVIAQMGAVGSLLIVGIGFRLLDIARVRVVNLLPAFVIGAVLAGVVDAIL